MRGPLVALGAALVILPLGALAVTFCGGESDVVARPNEARTAPNSESSPQSTGAVEFEETDGAAHSTADVHAGVTVPATDAAVVSSKDAFHTARRVACDKAIAEQHRDSWSVQMESSLATALSREEFTALEVSEITCGSTLCRVRATVVDETPDFNLKSAIAQGHLFPQGQFRLDFRDGNGTVIIYGSRAGLQLPAVDGTIGTNQIVVRSSRKL
jgi:hypothetical protein